MSSYIFALWDGGGAVAPELGVARRLIGRGHEVLVIADPTLRDQALGIGARFAPWVTAPHRTSTRRRRGPDPGLGGARVRSKVCGRIRDRLIAGPAGAQAADVAEQIAATPRCRRRRLLPVRRDDRRAGRRTAGGRSRAEHLGAARARRPADRRRVSARDGPDRPHPRRGARRDGEPGLREGTAVAERRSRRARTAAADLVLRPGAHRRPHPRAHQSRRSTTPLRSCRATCDTPARCSTSRRGPSRGRRRGARTISGRSCSSGLTSTFQDQSALLQRIIDALSGMPVRAVVTTGLCVDPGDLTASENVLRGAIGAARPDHRARGTRRDALRARHDSQIARRRGADGVHSDGPRSGRHRSTRRAPRRGSAAHADGIRAGDPSSGHHGAQGREVPPRRRAPSGRDRLRHRLEPADPGARTSRERIGFDTRRRHDVKDRWAIAASPHDHP